MKHYAIIILILSALPAGCSRHEDQTAAGKPPDPTILRLLPASDHRVATSRPDVEDSWDELDLGGRADFNPNLVTRTFSLVNGVISRIFVNQGTVVRKGDVLAEIFSGDFAGAVSDFQKAPAAKRTSEKNAERGRALAAAKIISQRELQQAVGDSAQAAAEYDRTAQILRLLDASRDSASAVYRLRAPIDGMVLERFAQIGSQVRSDNSQCLFTIGRIRSVWVILDVYQDQLPRVRVGDKVTLAFDGIPDTTFVTTIRYVSPVIDPTTLTAKSRCEIENGGGLIKPQMFCSARVYHRRGSSLFLPSSSTFFDDNGRSYVFAKVGPGEYQKRRVDLGQTFPEKVEVVRGVSPTDFIVTNDAIYLNEELLLTAH